ncbi:type II secretion system protein K [Saccharospirillum salsuginis]|uniref:Type II secretion system protein K n=1 Tax=Saccharospirillum salsuginis TaxID=418750 RepID=A0A918K872_9GAMM|nr:type II secretion system protein K [Saccharospirillum salsuginis]
MIQVLLVFAMLAVVVTRLQYEQKIQVERAYQSLTLSQAQAYLNSIEDFARVVLKMEPDLSQAKTDHFGDYWNEGVPLDYNGAEMYVKANDLQGRFNVNWLHPSAPNREAATQGFKRLLIHLQLDPAIADELKDWFDSDSNALFNYSDLDPAYRPSFEPMADVSEMKLLKSVDAKERKGDDNITDYEKLAPYLSALPPDTPLNINTASEPVFMTLASFISEQDAQSFVSERDSKDNGYTSTSEVTDTQVFQQNPNGRILIDQLTVESHWFDVYSQVTLNDRTYIRESTIHRTSESALVTRRTQAITEANTAPGDASQGSQGGQLPTPGQSIPGLGNALGGTGAKTE